MSKRDLKFKLTDLEISFVSGCPKGANQGAKVLLKKEQDMPNEDKTPEKINVKIDSEALGKSLGETLKKSLGDMLAKEDKPDAGTIADAVVAIVKGDVEKAVSGVQTELTKQIDAFQKEVDAKIAEAQKTQKEDVTDETLTIGGSTFKKSVVGDAAFEAIRASAMETLKLRKQMEHQDMVARVEKEYPNVAGDPSVKADILAMFEKSSDKVKEAGLAMLKSLNEAGKEFKKEIGSNAPSGAESSFAKFDTDDDATMKLDALAKEYAKKNSVDYITAYDAVLDTPEGAELYNKHLG